MIDRTTIQVSENLRKELRKLAASRDVNYQEILSDMVAVFKELDEDKTIVSIPKRLDFKIKQKLSNTDMDSTSEYVTFILRMLFSEQDFEGDEKIRKIKTRLKSLGYH